MFDSWSDSSNNGLNLKTGVSKHWGNYCSLPIKMKSWIESQGVRECREIPALMQRHSDSFGGSYSETISTTRDKKVASESHRDSKGKSSTNGRQMLKRDIMCYKCRKMGHYARESTMLWWSSNSPNHCIRDWERLMEDPKYRCVSILVAPEAALSATKGPWINRQERLQRFFAFFLISAGKGSPLVILSREMYLFIKKKL